MLVLYQDIEFDGQTFEIFIDKLYATWPIEAAAIGFLMEIG